MPYVDTVDLDLVEDFCGVVVSLMAILQENSTELVDAMLAGDELEALRTGDKLQAQGPAAEYLNYASSEGSISRRLRR